MLPSIASAAIGTALGGFVANLVWKQFKHTQEGDDEEDEEPRKITHTDV
ncbi:hypothetical protein [Halorubrum sp. AS12]